MKNCISVRHATCNEAGKEEVTLEYENGLIRSLLKKPTKKETFVGSGMSWRHKETGERVTYHKNWEIFDEVRELKRQASLIFI